MVSAPVKILARCGISRLPFRNEAKEGPRPSFSSSFKVFGAFGTRTLINTPLQRGELCCRGT
jgi:hypothetical protein